MSEERNSSAKNTVFSEEVYSLVVTELRRNCIFTHFCTQDSDFGLEELTLRKCTGLAPGEKRFCVLVPFWKSTTWFKLCLAGSNLIIYMFFWCFFFFYVKFLTWFGEHKICNSNFSPVHSSCNTEVTCKIALLHSVNMCVFPVSLVCKQSAQIRYFWILLVSLFCLILNSEHNSLSIVQEAFLSVACNI